MESTTFKDSRSSTKNKIDITGNIAVRNMAPLYGSASTARAESTYSLTMGFKREKFINRLVINNYMYSYM
ncbi:hypothetical protein HUJ04_004167 [Dendroctonus ponderosae]|nr:hypothetical protein HUJ04_004167 [Dendroctonus ponderosae]